MLESICNCKCASLSHSIVIYVARTRTDLQLLQVWKVVGYKVCSSVSYLVVVCIVDGHNTDFEIV